MQRGYSHVDESVEMSKRAAEALESITLTVGRISDLNIQTASAVEQQSDVTTEISRNISNIGAVSSKLAEASEGANKISNDLRKQTTTMGEFINKLGE